MLSLRYCPLEFIVHVLFRNQESWVFPFLPEKTLPAQSSKKGTIIQYISKRQLAAPFVNKDVPGYPVALNIDSGN